MPDDQSPQPEVPQQPDINSVSSQPEAPVQPEVVPQPEVPAQPEVSTQPEVAPQPVEAAQPAAPSTAGSDMFAAQPPVVPAVPGASAPMASPSSAPKTNKGLIIGLIIGAVLLLVGGGVALALMIGSQGDSKSNTSQNKSDDKKNTAADSEKTRAANAVTAKYLTDFRAVCEDGSISNAAAFTKPYKVVAFDREDGRSSYSSISLDYKADYNADYDNFTEANVVVCLNEDADARVKTKTCNFKDNVTVDYYASSYEAVAYEAKTGKKIQVLGDVNAPATKCPTFATYNPNDPKIIASPDSGSLDSLVANFAK